MIDWLPILVMLVVAVGFALASLGASYILSPKKATPEKLAPYECGIFPEVEPSQRFPVKFYMVAMLYIVFDIEIIFLFAWATRFDDLGWFGIAAILIFTFFVLETLYYVWKKGVLDWNIPRRERYLKEELQDLNSELREVQSEIAGMKEERDDRVADRRELELKLKA